MYDFMYEGPGRYKTSYGKTMIVRHDYWDYVGDGKKNQCIVGYFPGQEGFHRFTFGGVEEHMGAGMGIVLVGRRLDDAAPEPEKKPEIRRNLPLADGVRLCDVPKDRFLCQVVPVSGGGYEVDFAYMASSYHFSDGVLMRAGQPVRGPRFSAWASAVSYIAGINAAKGGDA